MNLHKATSRASDLFALALGAAALVLTLSVMSSEQEARRFPCGSHFIAFTSFCKTNMINMLINASVPTPGFCFPFGPIFRDQRGGVAYDAHESERRDISLCRH